MEEIELIAARLSEAAGLRGRCGVAPIPGSANNRVFRLDLGGAAYFLKVYFRHPEDPRDRLGAEFSFSRFAWENGIRCLARPMASDARVGAALYEFIDGRHLSAGEVTKESVRRAVDFYRALNERRETPGALALGPASEACFGLRAHLECVDRRLERLLGMKDDSPVHREAESFVRKELTPTWSSLRENILRRAGERGMVGPEELAREERRLSPSDFGFHNCLVDRDGVFRFVDFEYAGWDDPAKLVCDFFCQVKVPVPMEHCPDVVEAVASGFADPEPLRERIGLLMPAYRIKWCCILLNDFLPAGDSRRRFAGAGRGDGKRKAEQLDKARRALRGLEGAIQSI